MHARPRVAAAAAAELDLRQERLVQHRIECARSSGLAIAHRSSARATSTWPSCFASQTVKDLVAGDRAWFKTAVGAN